MGAAAWGFCADPLLNSKLTYGYRKSLGFGYRGPLDLAAAKHLSTKSRNVRMRGLATPTDYDAAPTTAASCLSDNVGKLLLP